MLDFYWSCLLSAYHGATCHGPNILTTYTAFHLEPRYHISLPLVFFFPHVRILVSVNLVSTAGLHLAGPLPLLKYIRFEEKPSHSTKIALV
jgi:hypothetical protein